jgi:sugar lactone lactonase YvrE
LNSPLLRSVDARLYNLRHQLLSAAELGDGGAVADIRLFDPMGLGRDPAGDLLVSDRGGGGAGRVVWRLGSDGTARIIAGTGRRGTAPSGIPARRSDLGSPQGLCVDTAGRVYFADSYNHVVLRIEEDGTLIRVAGNGRPGAKGDGGPATAAALNQPYDVRLDSDGNLYIADFGNHRVRKVTPDGLIETVAGRGEAGYSGDGGPATAALLNGPYGVYADARIGLLIADSHNHVIRVVDRRGHIRTMAGTGRRGLAGDGGSASSADFDTPQSVSVSASGSIYVGDEHNHVIRVIEPDGSIHRLAGTGRAGLSPDGTPADSGRLDDPENIVLSDDGTMLFTEAGNARVRYLGPDGRLGTIAGGPR